MPSATSAVTKPMTLVPEQDRGRWRPPLVHIRASSVLTVSGRRVLEAMGPSSPTPPVIDTLYKIGGEAAHEQSSVCNLSWTGANRVAKPCAMVAQCDLLLARPILAYSDGPSARPESTLSPTLRSTSWRRRLRQGRGRENNESDRRGGGAVRTEAVRSCLWSAQFCPQVHSDLGCMRVHV